MDRQTIYYGQVPREVDLLKAQQNAMVAMAKLCEAVLGTNTVVDGFQVTPTTPASLNVILTPGSIYQLENLEGTIWSSLLSDTSHSVLKQGIQLDPATFGITPPGTVGYSQVFIVQVQYQDLDTGSTVLPYWNASNPNAPFSGPANAGTAQNTVRKGAVAAQVKAGIAATTGTQTTPNPDAGWTALFAITVANGATSISSGNITQIANAPFISPKLPQVPQWVQSGSYSWALDTGSANAMVVSLNPAPASYGSGGLRLFVKKVNAANSGAMTINVNGLGPVAILDETGSPLAANAVPANARMELVFDGSAFIFVNGATTYTSVNSITAVSGEGIVVDGSNHVNLNYPGLTNNPNIADNDLISYYNNADGHHRDLTKAQLLAALSGGSGAFIKRWQAQFKTYVEISTVLNPSVSNGNFTGSPMTVTDGVQVLALTVTPRDANSVFDITFASTMMSSDVIGSEYVFIGIFRDDGTCVGTGEWFGGPAMGLSTVVACRDAPARTTPTTYSVRVAVNGYNGVVMGMNGRPDCNAGSKYFVGGLVTQIVANEIRA